MPVSEPVDFTDIGILAVEIVIGVIITVVVYRRSRKNEAKIKESVDEMRDNIKKQEDFRKEQIDASRKILRGTLYVLDKAIGDILVLDDEYSYASSRKRSQRDDHGEKVTAKRNDILAFSVFLDHSSTILPNFVADHMQEITDLARMCKDKLVHDKSNKINRGLCSSMHDIIKPLIKELDNDVPAKDMPGAAADTSDRPAVIKESVGMEETVAVSVISVSVSVDRTVYPLGSTVHMRANVPSLIQGEKISYRVFDSDKKLLLSQEIDPATHDQNRELTRNGVYQVSFKMEGSKWKIGKEYTVTATHGSASAEDSFSIEQIMPVVRSDKAVHAIGSDMIITVIDPDADKDNEVVEYVGSGEDSKLVIESPYGKIDGYRLKETGKSTGIFQGIIGILGIRRDGSVMPQRLYGRAIDRIQGTGIDDGFIGGAPGDKLTATYTNKAGTARFSFYISDFGATVEMDKQAYKAGDRVFLTVVAPDLSVDPDAKNEIGDDASGGHIEIKTGVDTIDGCRLTETGNDTGIFTGELQLEKTTKQAYNDAGRTKSDSRTLKCAAGDFIDVTLTLFGNKEYHCRASVEPCSSA